MDNESQILDIVYNNISVDNNTNYRSIVDNVFDSKSNENIFKEIKNKNLSRFIVNKIRHDNTLYEYYIVSFGNKSCGKIYRSIKRDTLNKISSKYKYLNCECAKQKYLL